MGLGVRHQDSPLFVLSSALVYTWEDCSVRSLLVDARVSLDDSSRATVSMGGVMIGPSTKWMLDEDILRCPACVSGPDRSAAKADPGRLEVVGDRWLVCLDCGRKYPVEDDIPQMLIEIGDKYRQIPPDELK